MVYPEDHASNAGGRDIIDGPSDVSIPYIFLIRHGSSDHLQPNFPTPGQIRSMFNTNKISECPEYAISPSTMSDPLEWRPSNQVEMLEERLMRIHQWNDNISSYVNRNYEGHSVNLSELGQTTERNMRPNETRPNRKNIEGVCRRGSNHNICDSDYETHSEMSGQSERVEGSDVDYNHREYDVEEYVEQINNCTDVSEASSNVTATNEIVKSDSKEVKVKSIDPESLQRQKHLEHIFNLTVKEEDNEFIGELKTFLLGILNNYFLQKDDKNKCSLSDDIRRVAVILTHAIADKDSVICDQVHELCLHLRDILVLKDGILNDPLTEPVKEELHHRQKYNLPSLNSTPPFKTNPQTADTKVNTKVCHNYINDDFVKEEVSDEKITMIHSYSTNKESTVKLAKTSSTQKESFESLIKFSRIPIPKSKLQKLSGTNQARHNQKNCPSPSMKHYGINGKELSDRRDMHSHSNKRVSTRSTRDIMQHKEEILRKAAILGLIDNVNQVPRIPNLTERAHLALLEKQIQGKLKSRHLALERRKYGLRDRLSNIKLNNIENVEIGVNDKKYSKIHLPLNVNTQAQEIKQQPTHGQTTKHHSQTTRNSNVQISYKLTHEKALSKETVVTNASPQTSSLNNESASFVRENFESRQTESIPKIISRIQLPVKGTQTIEPDPSSYETEERNSELVTPESYTTCFTDQEIPMLSSLASAAINQKKFDTYQSRIRNQPMRLNERSPKPPFIGILLPLLIVIIGAVFFVYQKQFFDLYHQWSFILHQLFEQVKMYDFMGKFEEQFGEVRKFVKAKCELL